MLKGARRQGERKYQGCSGGNGSGLQKNQQGISDPLNISVGMLPSAGEREQQELLARGGRSLGQGIMVVAAAGNNGPKENSVTIPGISRKIVTIGSSDDGKSEPGSGA